MVYTIYKHNMNTLSIALSSPTLSANMSTVLSAAPTKGKTLVTLDFIGFDETQYVINDLRIDWGDSTKVSEYKRDPVPNYANISIFNELLYGKIGGSIATQYTHTYNSISSVDIITYLLEIFAYYENGYRHDIVIYLPVYPESYYDTLDELDILSTQITSLSTNYTIINLESRKSGQTLVCILST